METEIKTKYCKISFHEEVDSGNFFNWAAVDFAWKDSDSPMSLIFTQLYDEFLLKEIRECFGDVVMNPIKDIYLEDVSIQVVIPRDKKHLGIKLLGVVESVETLFDNTYESSRLEVVK